MPEPGLGGRERRLCLFALVAVFSVVRDVQLAHWPILAESLRRQGYDETAIGLNAAARLAGIMFVAGGATWLIPRLGFFRSVLLGLVLVACVAVATAAMAIFPWLLPGAAGPWWSPAALALWSVVVAWGGTMGATFTVGLTLVGERFRGVELVAANAVYSFLFGLGGLAGPLLAGAAMDRFGPPGFPASPFAVAALYTLFAAWRQATRGWRAGTRTCDGTGD